MDSSRNPLVCPPIRAQAGATAPASSLTGRIQQFPQAQLRTAPDQGSVRIRPCGFLEESVWSPRGILELSTISCTCVHNRVNTVEQLEERSRMNPGQPPNLHRRRVFILETLRRHPHGTTPPEQRFRPQSTESTAPTTTSVLLIRDLSSKQDVWKVGRAAHRAMRSRFSARTTGRTRARCRRQIALRRRALRGMPISISISIACRSSSLMAGQARHRRVGLGACPSRGYGLMSVACARLRRRPIRQDPFEHRH